MLWFMFAERYLLVMQVVRIFYLLRLFLYIAVYVTNYVP